MKPDRSSSTQSDRFLVQPRVGVAPRPILAGHERKTLDDEAVVGLVEADLAHSALVEHRADRTQHFLVLLPRRSFVHAHGVSLGSHLRVEIGQSYLLAVEAGVPEQLLRELADRVEVGHQDRPLEPGFAGPHQVCPFGILEDPRLARLILDCLGKIEQLADPVGRIVGVDHQRRAPRRCRGCAAGSPA